MNRFEVVLGSKATGDRRYCSRSCARKVENAERSLVVRAAWDASSASLCPCGVGRIPYEVRHTTKHCSPECRAQYGQKRQPDPANYITFICENPACGKEVTRRKSYGSNPRFCSNSCAAKVNQAVHHVIDRETSTVLDSGWEALFWGLCRFLKIPIERVDRSRVIEWKPKSNYAPDFLVGSTWMEVKGLEDTDDSEKWTAWQARRKGRFVVVDHAALDHLRKCSREEVLDFLSGSTKV